MVYSPVHFNLYLYKGDLYGGSHYSKLCSADLTPQGRAMQAAALRFGDGETLPFTPCKKGYKPIAGSRPMYACPFHDKERRRRVTKDGGIFRKGEVDLNIFWKSTGTIEPAGQNTEKVEESPKKATEKTAVSGSGFNDSFKKQRVL
jgi:hypothetical protein